MRATDAYYQASHQIECKEWNSEIFLLAGLLIKESSLLGPELRIWGFDVLEERVLTRRDVSLFGLICDRLRLFPSHSWIYVHPHLKQVPEHTPSIFWLKSATSQDPVSVLRVQGVLDIWEEYRRSGQVSLRLMRMASLSCVWLYALRLIQPLWDLRRSCTSSFHNHTWLDPCCWKYFSFSWV